MALHLDKMQYRVYTVKNGVAVWGPLLSNVFITVDDFTEIFSQGRGMREEAAVLAAIFTSFSHILLSIGLGSKILTPIPLLVSGFLDGLMCPLRRTHF